MRKTLVGLAGVAVAVFAASAANAQQTIKIGVILAYSGQFADPSAQMDNGITPILMVCCALAEVAARTTAATPANPTRAFRTAILPWCLCA